MVKKISISLFVALLFSACSTSQDNLKPKNKDAIASDATNQEIKQEIEYEKHIKAVKRFRKKQDAKKKNKKKVDLDKFCFKDSKSIHYRAEEKCK